MGAGIGRPWGDLEVGVASPQVGRPRSWRRPEASQRAGPTARAPFRRARSGGIVGLVLRASFCHRVDGVNLCRPVPSPMEDLSADADQNEQENSETPKAATHQGIELEESRDRADSEIRHQGDGDQEIEHGPDARREAASRLAAREASAPSLPIRARPSLGQRGT